MTAVDERPVTARPVSARPVSARPVEDTERADLLRRTLRRHAAGVTVITVPGPAGFTATSFTW